MWQKSFYHLVEAISSENLSNTLHNQFYILLGIHFVMTGNSDSTLILEHSFLIYETWFIRPSLLPPQASQDKATAHPMWITMDLYQLPHYVPLVYFAFALHQRIFRVCSSLQKSYWIFTWTTQ